MCKFLLKAVLVLLPVLLFVHQRSVAQCALSGPSNTTVSTDAGKCGAIVNYTAPAIPTSCSAIQTIDTTFPYTGRQQRFVVPAGVTSIKIKTWGAMGGGDGPCSYSGGLGGYAAGTLAVHPGDTLYVYVGQMPPSPGSQAILYPGGYNGGGNSRFEGGGGGGASDVRAGDSSLSSRVIVAGGGGGAARATSCASGGAGGGLSGTNGATFSQYGPSYSGGGGGTQTGGGAAGNTGQAGSLGQGGNSSNAAPYFDGGGGGYYGGGSAYYGGGGGGSGYVGGVTDTATATGVNGGNGKVVISYSGPAILSVVQSAGLSSGTLFPVGTTTNTFALVNSRNDTLSQYSSTVIVTDNEKPTITCPVAQQFCYSSVGTYAIPQLSSSDNCGIQSTSYVITGATQRSGSGNNASGVFAVGTSTITWTVTDIHNNVSNCQTSVTVNSQIIASIADSKALSSGVSLNTVYIGYAPASSLTLTASASGGSGQFTYKWNTGATTQSITVSPTANTTYTVTVMDGSGCSSSMVSKGVKIMDVRCGNKMDKVSICHMNKNTLCIDADAVPDHLSHGDYLGACGSNTGSFIASASIADDMTKGKASIVYPNPSKGQFMLLVNSNKIGKKEVIITSPEGTTLQKREVEMTAKSQSLLFNLKGRASGTYLVKIVSENSVEVLKVIIQR